MAQPRAAAFLIRETLRQMTTASAWESMHDAPAWRQRNF